MKRLSSLALVLLASLVVSATSAGAEELNLFAWSEYVPQSVLDGFTKATGIQVNYETYASNEEMLAKLVSGAASYDLVQPSEYTIEAMRKENMLLPLDHAKIPNLKNVDPAFMDPIYDPGRKFSVPYTWLVLGIGYRKSAMKDGMVPDSWKWLYDSDQYKGRIALLSESGDLMRLGAKYLGHSVNGISADVLKQVEAMLIKQKPNVKAFHSDDGQDMLMSKEVDIVMEYNGDIAQVACRVVDIARDGLKRRGHGEEVYLAPLNETLALNKTPAERWLDKYNGEWGGDLSRIFDEAEI